MKNVLIIGASGGIAQIVTELLMKENDKQALVFSNPQIPYRWEHTNKIRSGYFCIFNQAFFHQYGNLN